MKLINKIRNKENGILLYGITPPKANTAEDRIVTIAQKQIERITALPIDGLVLYDIQDESSRTDLPRPFPFLSTLAPDVYSDKYLGDLKIPRIIYKSVGQFDKHSFEQWISQSKENNSYVFVGAPSKKQKTALSLNDAYHIKEKVNKKLALGGVTIPERHINKWNEHIRILDKTDKGCEFFVTQCVYNLDNAKSFISDYYYLVKEKGDEFVPIIFTLTPCGSTKTLEFMNWLGIDIPKWLKNDLLNSNDILEESLKICKSIAKALYDYCRKKGIPVGFNIESVAIRKSEIEASIDLLNSINELVSE